MRSARALALFCVILSGSMAWAASPFGIELGGRFRGEAFPVETRSMVEYHLIRSVPNPIEELSRYELMVGEGSRRVIGVRAENVFFDPQTLDAAFARVVSKLNSAYGKAEHAHNRRMERWRWNSGSMVVVLELRYDRRESVRLRLTFEIPH